MKVKTMCKLIANILTILLILGAQGALAQDYILKFGLLGPEGSSWADMAYKFKDIARERTHGKVSIKVYPGGSMGDEPELVQKLRLGQLQAAGLTAMGISKIAPETMVISLPFLFNDYNEIDYVLEKTKKLFSKIFEEKGFVFMGWTEVGFCYIFSQVPLRTFEDLRNVKIWTFRGDMISYEALKSMGFTNIITLSFLDVLASLEAGILNSFYIPLYPCIGFQWFTAIKYMTDFHVFYTPAGIVVEKKAFEKLPAEYQKMALNEMGALLKELTKMIRKDEISSLQALEAHGIKRIQPSPEFLSSLRERALPIHEKFIGTNYPPSLFNSVKQALTEYRLRNKWERSGI